MNYFLCENDQNKGECKNGQPQRELQAAGFKLQAFCISNELSILNKDKAWLVASDDKLFL
jgi:hypothetical protein